MPSIVLFYRKIEANKHMKFFITNLVLVSLLFLSSCNKSEEEVAPVEAKKSRMEARADQDLVAESGLAPSPKMAQEEVADSDEWIKNEKSENKLGGLFLPSFKENERLLEYDIQLSYECLDLIQTRKQLIEIISKFGYLESSSAVNSDSPSMFVRVHINSSKLYEALLTFDKLGNLLNENITTIDHTENQVWQVRKSNRETLRIKRKNIANSQITAGAKNWQAIDESLTQSEDQMDIAEHEMWKIQDKVKWAKVSLSFTTPMPRDQIQVPKYTNAFVGILNSFLKLTYYLLWIIPFLVFFGGLGWGMNVLRRRIWKMFKN